MEFLIIDFYQVGVHENFYKELKQYLRHERHTVAGRAGKGGPVYVNFLNHPKQKAPRGAGLGVVAHSNNRVSRTCFGGERVLLRRTSVSIKWYQNRLVSCSGIDFLYT